MSIIRIKPLAFTNVIQQENKISQKQQHQQLSHQLQQQNQIHSPQINKRQFTLSYQDSLVFSITNQKYNHFYQECYNNNVSKNMNKQINNENDNQRKQTYLLGSYSSDDYNNSKQIIPLSNQKQFNNIMSTTLNKQVALMPDTTGNINNNNLTKPTLNNDIFINKLTSINYLQLHDKIRNLQSKVQNIKTHHYQKQLQSSSLNDNNNDLTYINFNVNYDDKENISFVNLNNMMNCNYSGQKNGKNLCLSASQFGYNNNIYNNKKQSNMNLINAGKIKKISQNHDKNNKYYDKQKRSISKQSNKSFKSIKNTSLKSIHHNNNNNNKSYLSYKSTSRKPSDLSPYNFQNPKNIKKRSLNKHQPLSSKNFPQKYSVLQLQLKQTKTRLKKSQNIKNKQKQLIEKQKQQIKILKDIIIELESKNRIKQKKIIKGYKKKVFRKLIRKHKLSRKKGRIKEIIKVKSEMLGEILQSDRM